LCHARPVNRTTCAIGTVSLIGNGRFWHARCFVFQRNRTTGLVPREAGRQPEQGSWDRPSAPIGGPVLPLPAVPFLNPPVSLHNPSDRAALRPPGGPLPLFGNRSRRLPTRRGKASQQLSGTSGTRARRT